MREVIYAGDPIEAAEEFSRRVVAELGDEVDAVVLFGGVARGESDYRHIEVLVVAPQTREMREVISIIDWDMYEESGYTMPLLEFHIDADNLRRIAEFYSYSNMDLFSKVKVLHDNGTYDRARKVSGIGGMDARRR